MFDKFFVQGRPVEHHTHITQLPHDTADAARLYGEMVKKAREEVREAVVREAGASIRVAMINLATNRSCEDLNLQVRLLFSINGHIYDIKTTETGWEQDVHRAIAEHIAIEVVAKLRKR